MNEKREPQNDGSGLTPAALGAILHGDLDNARVALTPGGIEAQEAAGQCELVSGAWWPKEVRNASREQLLGLGFRFGADVDALFVECALPAGWAERPTEASLLTDGIDSRGRPRAKILYKAAFYDRYAFAALLSRYTLDCYRAGTREGWWVSAVTDAGAPIYTAGERCGEENAEPHYLACLDWLDERYPRWRDPLAYWEPGT